MYNRGDVLTMILPRPVARCDLVKAASVRVHECARRSARAQIQRVANSVPVFIGLAQQRKGCIKGALMGDVCAHPQPVRSQSVIADPALQVGSGCEWGSWSDYGPG